MIESAHVEIPFHHYSDGNPVFVKSRDGIRADFGKNTPAKDRERQAYFNSWLDRLAEHLNVRRIPIFIEWSSGELMRMDKGCIGHALAAGKISEVVVGSDGFVSHIILEN